MLGKHHTEETKKKIGEINKDRMKNFWDNPKNQYKRELLRKRYEGSNSPLFGIKYSKERIKEMSEISKRVAQRQNYINPNYNKKTPFEVRKKISKSQIEWHRTHAPKYPIPVYVKKLGHKVRSKWEKEIALILKNNKIRYEYEPEHIDLITTVYTPDFRLNDNKNIYIEVKGYFPVYQQNKIKKMKRMYPEKRIIGIGDRRNNKLKLFHDYLYWNDRDKLPDLLKNNYHL